METRDVVPLLTELESNEAGWRSYKQDAPDGAAATASGREIVALTIRLGLVLLLAASAPLRTFADPPATITGTVRDPGGQAVPGLTLSLAPEWLVNNHDIKTDAKGQFEITPNRQNSAGVNGKFCIVARDSARNLAVAEDIEEGTTTVGGSGFGGMVSHSGSREAAKSRWLRTIRLIPSLKLAAPRVSGFWSPRNASGRSLRSPAHFRFENARHSIRPESSRDPPPLHFTYFIEHLDGPLPTLPPRP